MESKHLSFLVGGVVLGVVLAAGVPFAMAGGFEDGWMSMTMGGHHAAAGGHHDNHGGGSHHGHHGSSGTGGSGTGAPPPNGSTVIMENNRFTPEMLTVKAGTTVTWVNRDGYAHTITSDQGDEMDSPYLGEGESWSHTFTEAGTYWYHCEPHSSLGRDGAYQGMTGVVRVVTGDGGA